MRYSAFDPSQRASWVVSLLLLVAACSGLMAQPTVNGLFYGDGDDALYTPYATSVGGSVLYSYYDVANTTLYVALVVSQSVNDEVCSPRDNKEYTSSAGWNQHRSCKRGSDSEYASFTFACAEGSPKSWSWQQALGCAQSGGSPPSDWVSDPSCGPSTDASTWPPGIDATSSWVTNVNTYQAAAPSTRAWDLYVFGTDLDKGWKSPFIAAAPDDVTQVPGYPTYSATDGSGKYYNWEWSMVYEWSLDIGSSGLACGDEPIFVISGVSHHSPPKSGDQNDPFPPPSGDPTFSDWGDLPDTYATTDASGGARHYIKVSAPYLGSDIQSELDGSPTADATGDGDEEDGVTITVTDDWTVGSIQSIDVTVSNAPEGAFLGGWFDWNNDGDFDDVGEFFSWSVIQGSNSLDLTVGTGFDWQNDNLYARFRLFSNGATAPGGSLDQGDSAGVAEDGEVEDYRYLVGTLPVTLNAFATEGRPGDEIAVRWQTASETNNVAFQLRGMVNGKWRELSDLIASQKVSSALAQTYEIRISAPRGLTQLQLLDYDTAGRPETFGSFRLGGVYGEFQPEQEIDWGGPRAEREAALEERGFTDTERNRALSFARPAWTQTSTQPPWSSRWKKVRSGEPATAESAGSYYVANPSTSHLSTGRESVEISNGPATHIAVSTTGIQRVTYEMLRDGGLDLAGVQRSDIAITWRGEPVQRWIDGPEKFGPGSTIEFLGQEPEGDDALYIDSNLYQISIDSGRARSVGTSGPGAVTSTSSPWYRRGVWIDRPFFYHHQSPTGDPWVEQTVLAQGGKSPVVVPLEIPVADPLPDSSSRLIVGLGTITDLPDLYGPSGEALPEHNVEIWLRQQDDSLIYITTVSTSGQHDWRIEADLAPGLLEPGINRVELHFSTDYLFSLVVVDKYGVLYPTRYRGPRLDFDPDPSASGYRIKGFRNAAVSVYEEGLDGSLTRITPHLVRRSSPRPVGVQTGWVLDRGSPDRGRYAIEFQGGSSKHFWVTETPITPTVFTTEAPPDLFSDPADLVVIAGSSFVGGQALEEYLDQRANLNPVVVDVEDIYNAVGFGMALPSAITRYLALRDTIHPFTKVQLVGTDCYDRLNYVSSCISYIPLPTARVNASFFAPSQNRLVDLDGDGIGDKAVAQFSVREEAELATIVAKGLAWQMMEPSERGSALLIAEETDGSHDFEAQIERLQARLGWHDAETLLMADFPEVQGARDALRSALDNGRSVTTFSGHSSASIWGFRGLLTPDIVASLENHGRPTMMVPLACETAYDISPNANVLGHQLLFGGDFGALAISGAASLANLTHNELMATYVLEGLKSGLSLGEAVLAGRRALGRSYQELQDNWTTQGDVAVRLVD